MYTDPEQVRFWRLEAMGGLELLNGRYRKHAFPRHVHDRYVISAMVEGREALWHRGVRTIAPAGSIILLNPGVWHENRGLDGQGFAYRTFYISRAHLEALARDLADDSPVRSLFDTPVVTDDLPLAGQLIRLHRALEQEPTLRDEEMLIRTWSRLLTRHAMVQAAVCGPLEPYLVTRVRDYLAAHLTRRVRLEELAVLVDRSPCHVLRTFHRAVGATPHQFQTQIRIQRALDRLRSGCPIGDTALAVGFADQSHFTRQFTRTVGVPPGCFARASRTSKTHPLRRR
jgi:AraC-like DNA-binding protein